MKYVYKIIAAIGALSSIPLIIFGNLISYRMKSAGLETLFYLGQLFKIDSINEYLQNSGGKIPEYLGDDTSLYELYQLISSVSGSETDGNIMEKLDVLIAPALTLALVLVLVAICGIVTAVLAFVCKDNRKVIYSSVAGIGLSLMIPECIEAISEILLSGTIKFSTILGSSFADMIGSFEKLDAASGFWFIPLVFLAVIVWTVLYNITLPENEKRERKLMLGEAD